jgi:hypothetical protein
LVDARQLSVADRAGLVSEGNGVRIRAEDYRGQFSLLLSNLRREAKLACQELSGKYG